MIRLLLATSLASVLGLTGCTESTSTSAAADAAKGGTSGADGSVEKGEADGAPPIGGAPTTCTLDVSSLPCVLQ